MKKLLLASILTLVSIGCFGQSFAQLNPSVVDERVELVSVVCRMAEYAEYSRGTNKEYQDDVLEYFYPYSNHEIIPFLVQMRNQHGFGYGQVALSALCLQIDEGKVSANSEIRLGNEYGFKQQWPQNTFKEYVKLLNDFYRESDFSSFFENHKTLYVEKQTELDFMLSQINTSWFSDFFGGEFRSPKIYLAMGNGSSNYCIPDLGDGDFSIIIGHARLLPELIFPVVIHELCHVYANPLLLKHWEEIEPDADKIFDHIADDMAKNAYGDARASIIEGFINVFTLMYFRDNTDIHLGIKNFYLGRLKTRGFIWLPRAVDYMENFYANRAKYPHINSYMGQLVGFFHNMTTDFEWVISESQNRHPYVVSVFPSNGVDLLTGDFSEIRITFSHPMAKNYAIGWVKNDDTFLRIPRSETIDAFWDGDRILVIPIEKSALEKNKKYGINLEHHFMTLDYDPMLKDYLIIYNTTQP